MAEEGEDRNSGGDEKKREFPTGFRFEPTDEELVKYYLLPRLQGRTPVKNDAIIEANVYQYHPDKLINKMYKGRGENGWYFLSPRARKYQNGDRPSRNTDDNLGRWKASTGRSEVKEMTSDGTTKFCESVLAYFEGPIKTEKKTKWLMHELTIPQYENKLDKSGKSSNNKTLDEYVMCRIYVTPRHKGENEDEAGSSSASASACHEECSSSQPGPAESGGQEMAEPKLSERQAAGKRSVEEQHWGGATAPKRARLTLGPPGPVYGGGGGMQVPFGTLGYYGGGTVRRTVYNGQVPMPRTVYNGQVPMPRPPVAPYNGRTPAQLRPVAYNCQAPPGQWQPAAYNGQAPPVQWQPAVYNGQALVQRPPLFKQIPSYRAPNYFGQTTTMMGPLNPAGQAVKGPPPVQAPPPKQERSPETEEMQKERVYQC